MYACINTQMSVLRESKTTLDYNLSLNLTFSAAIWASCLKNEHLWYKFYDILVVNLVFFLLFRSWDNSKIPFNILFNICSCNPSLQLCKVSLESHGSSSERYLSLHTNRQTETLLHLNMELRYIIWWKFQGFSSI